MLLRKTSAATAFRGLLVGVMGFPWASFLAFALMVSLRRFTEEREMRRMGLSLERRIGLLFSGADNFGWIVQIP